MPRLKVDVGASSRCAQIQGQPAAPAIIVSPTPSVRALRSDASPEVERRGGAGISSSICARARFAERMVDRAKQAASVLDICGSSYPLMKIDVVIPALDEERALPHVLAEIPRPPVRRIVVSDNGSRD